jgi:hypothetical protein
MAPQNPLTDRALIAYAAVVGAHAQSAQGFRQRDLRFLIELFTNWTNSPLSIKPLTLHNTQIARTLEHLVAEGYARKITQRGPKASQPRYRLTRIGLLELLSRMAQEGERAPSAQFFFLYYFLTNYGPRLTDLVKQEGAQFPYALAVELEELLNGKKLLQRKCAALQQDLKRIDARIRDAYDTSALVKRRISQRSSLSTITQEIEESYPYELNSQKPLSELVHEIPEQFRLWELETGTKLRAQQLWEREKILIKGFIAQIEVLNT